MHHAFRPLYAPFAESFGAESNAGASKPAGDELRAVVEAIPDLMIRMDARGNVLDLKPAFSSESISAAARSEMLAAHVNTTLTAAAAKVIASQTLLVTEYPVEREGGARYFEARIAPVLKTQAVAFIRDITTRKRAEEELFSSREMLRKILDTIPQRVFWKDLQSVYIGCNRPFAQDTGIGDPAAIVGKGGADTASRELLEFYRADDQQVMRSDKPKLNYEEPQDRPNGARRWLRTSKVPLHDALGRVIGLLGAYDDITDLKVAEQLRTGQSRVLEMIVDGAPLYDTLTRLAQVMESLIYGMQCTILLVDPDGERLRSFVAPALSSEFTQTVDGIRIGEGYGCCGTAAVRRTTVISTDVRTDPKWARYTDFVERFDLRSCWSMPILSTGDALLGTFAMYFKQSRSPSDGERQLISVASHLAGIAIQRKQTEEALRKAEEKYRNIFEQALDGIFQITPEGKIIEANPAFARMFGYESAATMMAQVGDVGRDLCAEPTRYIEFVQTLQTRGVVQRWELPMRRPNGQPVWISIDARVAAAPGQTLCFEGIAKDITERKRLEQQFMQAQKMEAFGQLAGGVAHDFNNLLTVILGNLSLIRLGDLPPGQRESCFEDCLRAAERAANLTGQLLTFSRRHHMEPRDIDLNEVVANVSGMLRRLIGEHITLRTQPSKDGARVRADSGMIEQAVMNLALNSRDAMPKGGVLLLKVDAVDLDATAVMNSPRGRPGSFVRLTVSDTGTGIAPEHLAHIFEPFFTTKDVGKGTGLGLATVFGIVDQHAGWLDVESTLGAGTTMSIYLPRLSQGAASFSVDRHTNVPRKGTETVLVVEDELDVRLLVVKVLKQKGYHVHAAANGPEALACWKLHRNEIDLVVTDMVMPGGMGGRELAEQLKADKPGLKVIYCSGYTDDVLGTDQPLRETEMFLEKPFDVLVLLDRVRASLDNK